MMMVRSKSFSSSSAPLLVWIGFTWMLLLLPCTTNAGPLDNCPIDCGPNGHCFDGECECDAGFAGADCSFPYEICPDHIMQCFGTGAQCVKERTNDDNSSRQHAANGDGSRIPEYTCHCNTAANTDAFEIKQCETPVSHHCEQDTLLSEYAFCTNGGTCRAIVRRGERHAGCHCPTGYEGRHCQYRQGTAPAYELQQYYPHNTSTGALDGFVKFLIAAICLCLMAGFAYIVYYNYQAKQARAVKEIPDEDEEMITDMDQDTAAFDEKKRQSIETDLTMDVSGDELDDQVPVETLDEQDNSGIDVDKGEMA